MVDVLADFNHEDSESLLASFRERDAGMVSAIARAREAGVPVIYVNDERDRWDSDALALAREAMDGPGGDVVRPLLPQEGDRVLLKHHACATTSAELEQVALRYAEEVGGIQVGRLGSAPLEPGRTLSGTP